MKLGLNSINKNYRHFWTKLWMKERWTNRNEETLTQLHSLYSPTSAFWVNGRLKWARHAACKQKTNAYKIWFGKLHGYKPVGGTCLTRKDNIKKFWNKLFGFNYLKMESSGESIKFHYNMGCLEQLSSFLKEILYLAISIHDVPWLISTIPFFHTSALVTGKYVEWWLAGQT